MSDSSSNLLSDIESHEPLLDALARVLASKTFADVLRLKKFLEYSTTETIAGRGDRLKGFVIACEVFDKEDPSDAHTTTVVRVEAGRLRRRLKDYYEAEGKRDPVRISMPKGGYSVLFTATGKIAAGRSSDESNAAGKAPLNRTIIWVAALVLLALVYTFPGMKESDSTGAPLVLPGTKPTIAVMPFGNLTGEGPGDSFASGLTEDIVIDLGSMAMLDVISISSVLQYKGLNLSPAEVGAQLGVGYVLEGSVRRLPPRLRVTARLSDTTTGLQLWAERFDSQSGDELALQEELARRVVTSLSISLPEGGAERFGRRYTQNKSAWFLYKQAMNLANPPSDPNRLDLALQAFQQVTEMDRGFAGGFAGSAYVKAFMVFFGHSQDPDSDRKAAMELAARARELDPSFGLTYSALAFIHLSGREFESALSMSAQAIEIQPNDPYVTVYHGIILGLAGDLENGLDFANRALRLDPLNARTPYLNIIGLLYYLTGQYDEALKAMLRNQERGGPIGPGQMQFLAAIYSQLGDFALAEATLNMADGLKSGVGRSENWLLRSFKDPAIAQELLDEMEAIRSRARLNPSG